MLILISSDIICTLCTILYSCDTYVFDSLIILSLACFLQEKKTFFTFEDGKREKYSILLSVTTIVTYSFPLIPNPHNFLLPPTVVTTVSFVTS